MCRFTLYEQHCSSCTTVMNSLQLRVKECKVKKRTKQQMKKQMQAELEEETPPKTTKTKQTRVRGHSFSDRAVAAATVRRGLGGAGGRRMTVGSGAKTAPSARNCGFVKMAASHFADDPFVGKTRLTENNDHVTVVTNREDTDMDDYDCDSDDDETEEEDDDETEYEDEDEDEEMEEGDIEYDGEVEGDIVYDGEVEVDMEMDVDMECKMVQEDTLPLDYGICWKCGGLKGTLELQVKYCL